MKFPAENYPRAKEIHDKRSAFPGGEKEKEEPDPKLIGGVPRG